ncbi:hypothetical protein [Streptomyces chrestomyceticus]|uniref:hypothetical protein n=1 Tax=Streptomyces chrestomyceticus TaxID=68185 RepID=UPI0033F36C31
MELPFIVVDQLTPQQERDWHAHFGTSGADRPRDIEEGIWRRTQEPATAAQSGWQPGDARRRMVHYRYRYGLAATTGAPALALRQMYLYHHAAAPAEEIGAHWDAVRAALHDGGWKPDGGAWKRGDLHVVPTLHSAAHPEDLRAGRTLPPGYACLDVQITSSGYVPPPATRRRPWDVLASGVRQKAAPGMFRRVPDLAALADYLPFQVEIGCGTSWEAGIPALHRLREIYRVTTREDDAPGARDFVLRPQDDPLLREFLAAPEEKAEECVELYRACFLARPTPALYALKELHDAGYMVGPVITNNFDVLPARVGLRECFMRRYDQSVPEAEFVDGAKALLVVGLHADRRQVAARARERGMKVIHCDPEGFWHGGIFHPYPLEGPQDGDLVCTAPAGQALPALAQYLLEKVAA